ncbi:bone morphogenetic protein 1-like [Montipora foliosa]|uniref:bone morphogenetic protein 1-like n=1 Tax=Montipora foliosa TaxID=591990 RepID=UPI0035F13877
MAARSGIFGLECKDKQVIDLANEPSGTIHVINFTSTYYKGDIYCLWRFEAPSSQKVLIYFTFFDMGSSYCSFASVTISEEPRFGEREILMEACGYKTPRPVITSEGLAELTFHSIWFQKGRGFVAHYKVLNSTTGCGGSLQYIDLFYQQNGTIYSPNYPSTYGTSEDCHWRIHAYTFYRERKVLLYFSSFDLDAHCCSCGYLEIFDGPSENFKLLTRVCGDSLPSPVISSNDYIYLKFRSNSSVRQGRGRFVAHYRELYRYKGCPSIDHGALTGVIYNRGFPFEYGANFFPCHWDIKVPSGMMINLTFSQFDLISGNNGKTGFCSNFVQVQDNNRYKRKLCGSLAPFSLVLFESVSVAFSSSSGGTGGFLAYYQITAKSLRTSPYKVHHYTLKPTFVSPAPLFDACRPYSQNKIHVQDSSSLSIASPTYQASPEMTTTCSWQISTREGYILRLVFLNLTISKCDETCCPYRYIQARDGNGLRDSLLGTYCGGNYPSEVSTTGNQIYVKYYGLYSNDTFEATVLSHKAKQFVDVLVIVLPVVAAVVVIIVIVITVIVIKKRRTSRETESSAGGANAGSLQSPPETNEVAPLYSHQDPHYSRPTSV